MKKRKNKKTKEQKISFLVQRKNIDDKFFDLVKEHITVTPDKNGKFKRNGVKKLAAELEITTATLNRYIKSGSINRKNDELFINVERNFDKLKKPRTKKVTKEFSTHTFTFQNFFKRKPFGKIKSNEQLYFRAGLYLVFKSGKNGTYTIQNLPISHYSNLYPEGYEEFYEIIKEKLQNHPSLKYFRFNYFDVTKIDLGNIEDRLEKFKAKNYKTKKRKK